MRGGSWRSTARAKSCLATSRRSPALRPSTPPQASWLPSIGPLTTPGTQVCTSAGCMPTTATYGEVAGTSPRPDSTRMYRGAMASNAALRCPASADRPTRLGRPPSSAYSGWTERTGRLLRRRGRTPSSDSPTTGPRRALRRSVQAAYGWSTRRSLRWARDLCSAHLVPPATVA